MAKEVAITAVVPRHGLDAFARVLKYSMGSDLRSLTTTDNRRPWDQIHTAFEVRHLIEHSDGKADSRFRSAVDSSWVNSSWTRHGELTALQKVHVDGVDAPTHFWICCRNSGRPQNSLIPHAVPMTGASIGPFSAYLLGNQLLQERKLSQADAAKVLGITQPKVSALRHYKLAGFSVERLMNLLTALDQDVEIVIRRKPRSRKAGRISVVAA